jgi:hypothetical protein
VAGILVSARRSRSASQSRKARASTIPTVAHGHPRNRRRITCASAAPPADAQFATDEGSFSGPLLYKQQSRRRYAANGFAFVPPNTCRVLGRHRWVAELASEVMRQPHLRPILPLKEEGRSVRPRKNSAS